MSETNKHSDFQLVTAKSKHLKSGEFMQRLPAKCWMRGSVHEMTRYVGRVRELNHRCYVLHLWRPREKNRDKGWYANIVLKTKGLTVVGKIQTGDAVELWTWIQMQGRKTTHRMHIKRL
jgi:hypothetical protein